MSGTTIGSLFEKDINRPINGVIKVGQLEEAAVHDELEEYVLTPEVRREFNRLFAHYVAAQGSDQIGVWISGFFGSGKSHFLKMLSYLLANRVVSGRPALEWFRSQVRDANLEAMLFAASQPSAEVILFNIDAEAAADGKQNAAIVRVFQKVFDVHRGYFGTDPNIARFERLLDEAGQLEAFKQAFERTAGVAWVASRDAWDFHTDAITEAIQTARGMTSEAARKLLEAHGSHAAPSPKEFALEVKRYLEARPGIRVVFMVDEVGQYIGANTDLMLNLQTIVEELGTQCRGRAWVMVTSQEDLDSLIGLEAGGSSRKKDDFSKIQGRFLKPVSLSSKNADEVIQLRLLDKTASAKAELEVLFERSEAALGTLLRFNAHKDLRGYRDAGEFVRAYPFVPYQFPLLQDVFTQARRMGASGRHLASGERSMLDAFKIASQAVQHEPVGMLAPFHLFYAAIEGFLEGAVKRVIERAKDNPNLKPEDVNVLKTLFMVKYVQGFDGNLENLTTLALTHVDEDRVALRARLEASLVRLESQTLVSRTADRYTFLTDDEQDVTRQINSVAVDPASVAAKLQEIVWDEIFTDKKHRADKLHEFGFNRLLDGRAQGRQTEQLSLHVVTPESEWHDRSQAALAGSGNALEALIVLPDDKRLMNEARVLLRTEGFLRIVNTAAASPQLKLVIEAKRTECADRRTQLRAQLEEALRLARVLVSMRDIPSGNDPKAPFKAALEALVRDNFNKLEMVKSAFETDAQVDVAFQKPLLDGPNTEARAEVKAWLERQTNLFERVTVKSLVEAFHRAPYGWSELDALGVMAELVSGGAVELRFAQGEARLEAGLTARIRGKGGLESHTLRVPRPIDPMTLSTAREVAREVYAVAMPTNDPRELAALHATKLQEREAKAKTLLERARGGHPFAAELETILGRWEQLTKVVPDWKTLLETIHTARAELEADWERLEEIEGFYTRQFSLYQEARAALATLRADAPHVAGSTVNEAIRAVTDILESDALTKDLPRVKALLEPAQRAVNAERERLRGRVTLGIHAAIQDLEPLRAQAEQPDALRGLEALSAEVATLERLDAIIAREAVALARANEIRTALLEALSPRDAGQPAVIVKTVRAPRRTIRTAPELEAYLTEFRVKVCAELERGATVTIE